MNPQTLVLGSLLTNEPFVRKVAPFIKPEYFEDLDARLFRVFAKYMVKYNTVPNKKALSLLVDQSNELNGYDGADIQMRLDDLYNVGSHDQAWLLDTTEQWCQERALQIAIFNSIDIIEGKHPELEKGALPDLLSKALSVSFDTHIGHDYLDDAQARFDYYHTVEAKLPFDIDYLNKITGGGIPKKTLNIIMAGTGVGKSLLLCHFAADYLSQGKNVLYISMEMAEERLAERIDANLFDVDIKDVSNLSENMFKDRIGALQEKTHGKLVIKEYPTGSAHVGHFRALLNELKLKRKFIPDVLIIDYLNICASSRVKGLGGSVNTYSYVKMIAEEVRGLGIEFDIPVWSATQTNRSGYSNTDPGLEDTSESFGLPQTADLMLALVSNEELENNKQVMVKQLKNRYNDPNMDKRFLLGIERAKMKVYDIPEHEQNLNNETSDDDDIPLFDKTEAGHRVGLEKYEGFA